jgi:hypothetical protein
MLSGAAGLTVEATAGKASTFLSKAKTAFGLSRIIHPGDYFARRWLFLRL